jgi:glycosyltransferase involved in cell wall biosynthesis
MKGAVALLQPSLYEGWSTLVEESKALGRFVILSDLPVHREQITTNVAFFDPYNADELADKIVQQLTNPSPITPIDYNSNIKVFGEEILSSFAFE